MELGDLLVKIAQNRELSSLEWEFLRQQGNQIQSSNDRVATWVKNGANSIAVDTVYARNGVFEYPPSGIECRVWQYTDQNITHSNLDLVTLDTEVYDDLSMWSVSDPTKMYIKVSGRYLVIGRWFWGSGGAGARHGYLGLNGSTAGIGADVKYLSATSQFSNLVVTELNANAGDYFSLYAFQTSGGGSLALESSNLTISLRRRIVSET